MLARDIYKQICNKAEEVKEAIHAVLAARGEEPEWNADTLIEYFSVYTVLSQEADIQKDKRRHIKVLYADYCGLRDELLMLLTTAWYIPSRLLNARDQAVNPKDNPLVDDEGCTPYQRD